VLSTEFLVFTQHSVLFTSHFFQVADERLPGNSYHLCGKGLVAASTAKSLGYQEIACLVKRRKCSCEKKRWLLS